MKHNLEKIMNICFYILTFLCVLFTFQYIFGVKENGIVTNRTILGIFILIFYLTTYYCHRENLKHNLEKYYIEKEKYNELLNQFTKKERSNKYGNL